jgi:peptidylprolyl isomerase
MGRVLLTIFACLALVGVGCGGGSSGGETSSGSVEGATAEEGRDTTKSETSSEQSESADGATDSPLWLTGPQAPIRYQKELKLKPSGLAGAEPKPFIPNAHRPDRIVMKDLLDGIGTYAAEGDSVVVQYVGYDYETGRKFASSWDKGRPVTFRLGAGEVLPAWEEALNGMEIGDRRVVVAPPKLAEGEYPPSTPPGKTVAFILELLPRGSKAKAEPASLTRPPNQ